MGSYIPATGEERQAMLQAIGLTSVEELFDVVPEAVRVKNLDLPEGLSEWEVSQTMASLAEKNRVFRSVFRGAGAYRHYIPSIVKTVTSKEEFLTAYTPYQAEISQGVLQSIFEYQTQMCELTGMEVSNASVYDGAVAAAEAIFMCQERKRTSVVVSGAADPQTLAVIKTYCESRDVPVTILPVDGCATDPARLAGGFGRGYRRGLCPKPQLFRRAGGYGCHCLRCPRGGGEGHYGGQPHLPGPAETPGGVRRGHRRGRGPAPGHASLLWRPLSGLYDL